MSETIAATSSPYDQVAEVYDALARFYSGGAISHAKKVPLNFFRRGDRVLYVGAGTGEDCVHAASQGVSLTAVDSSARMLARLSARLKGAELPGTLINADVRELVHVQPPLVRFDAVVAPFFLNVFATREVGDVWRYLSKLVKPGGLLINVDFRGPSPSAAFRLVQNLYYLPPLALFHLATQNPWHRLYDYRQIAQKTGTNFRVIAAIPTRAFGLPLFETLIWRAP